MAQNILKNINRFRDLSYAWPSWKYLIWTFAFKEMNKLFKIGLNNLQIEISLYGK